MSVELLGISPNDTIWPLLGLVVGLVTAVVVAVIQRKPTQLQISDTAYVQLEKLSHLYREDIESYRQERSELAKEREEARRTEALLRAELGEARTEIATLRVELEAAREEVRSLRLGVAAQQRLLNPRAPIDPYLEGA